MQQSLDTFYTHLDFTRNPVAKGSHLGSPPVTLMNSERPADFKNSMQYLSLIQHGAETCQNSRKGSMVFLDISKICLNFMA